jgi:hypothetical protein
VWNWGVVFDFHHTGPTGQANFQIASLPTGLELWVSGGATVVNAPTDPGFYRVSIGTVQLNVWYDFVYHVKWSSGSDGYFQAWLNGRQVMNFSGPTLYTGQSCYLKLANYHTPLGVPVSVIHSRIVRATTQADVVISSSGGSPPPPVNVTVAPATATLQTGASQSFTATVTNTTNTAVSWKVNGVTGGDATVGVISASGDYSAPSLVPSPSTVTVTAVSAAGSTLTGSAQVTISAPSSAGPPGPAPAAGSGGGGGSMDAFTLLGCALALACACRRRGVRRLVNVSDLTDGHL